MIRQVKELATETDIIHYSDPLAPPPCKIILEVHTISSDLTGSINFDSGWTENIFPLVPRPQQGLRPTQLRMLRCPKHCSETDRLQIVIAVKLWSAGTAVGGAGVPVVDGLINWARNRK